MGVPCEIRPTRPIALNTPACCLLLAISAERLPSRYPRWSQPRGTTGGYDTATRQQGAKRHTHTITTTAAQFAIPALVVAVSIGCLSRLAASCTPRSGCKVRQMHLGRQPTLQRRAGEASFQAATLCYLCGSKPEANPAVSKFKKPSVGPLGIEGVIATQPQATSRSTATPPRCHVDPRWTGRQRALPRLSRRRARCCRRMRRNAHVHMAARNNRK